MTELPIPYTQTPDSSQTNKLLGASINTLHAGNLFLPRSMSSNNLVMHI